MTWPETILSFILQKLRCTHTHLFSVYKNFPFCSTPQSTFSICCPIHKSSNKVNWVFKCTHLSSVVVVFCFCLFFFLTHSYTHVLVYTYTRDCLWGHGVCLASVLQEKVKLFSKGACSKLNTLPTCMTISTEK